MHLPLKQGDPGSYLGRPTIAGIVQRPVLLSSKQKMSVRFRLPAPVFPSRPKAGHLSLTQAICVRIAGRKPWFISSDEPPDGDSSSIAERPVVARKTTERNRTVSPYRSAFLAQPVEQLTCNQKVEGSIPSGGTTFQAEGRYLTWLHKPQKQGSTPWSGTTAS